MKIRIMRNGPTGTIKEFENKGELFDFVKCELEKGGIIENDVQAKILNTQNYNQFSIYELIEQIDYERYYSQKEIDKKIR